MPGTPAEMIALVNAALARPEAAERLVGWWRWADGTGVSASERADLAALLWYTRHLREQRRDRPAQRRAMRLLRSLLPAPMRAELRRRRCFHVRAASGATYRLDPRIGLAERVERHGGRWYATRSFCLHDADDEGKMPPADRTVAHLLLLMADEPAFLATANATRCDDQLWNRDYLRRARRAPVHTDA
jgi:hypothetical protein